MPTSSLCAVMVGFGLCLGLTACSDEPSTSAPNADDTSSSSTTGGSSTTMPIPSGDCANRPDGSSPATFDAAGGTYSAQGLSLDDGARSLTFNVVQWLVGEDARRAWLADSPGGAEDREGPPNDYYIVDDNDRLRTLPIRAGAAVFLTHVESDANAAVETDTLEGLDAYLDSGTPGATFWLSFAGGEITEICEQFRP